MRRDRRGRLARALVRAVAPLVPADRRPAWRRQWLADLHHHRDWLASMDVPPARAERDLIRRAAGALSHAGWLRWHAWRTNMIAQDVKYAVRALLRRPGFSAVIVLTLALGIGANSTIFSWIDALVFNPLPGVRDVSSLVVLRGTTATRDDLSFSYPNYRDLRDATPDGLDGLLAFRTVALGIRVGGGEPERTWAELVSGNYFDLLGVRPERGRLVAPADDGAEGAGAVIVLSDQLWRRRFGASPGVIGSAVGINGHPFTVVGIAAPPFKGATNGLAVEAWVPLSMQAALRTGSRLDDRGSGWLEAIGRVAPGASRARAAAGLAVVARRLAEQYPVNKGRGVRLGELRNDGAGEVLVPVMTIVMAVVAIVLVIACANIAGLMIARGVARRREVAVRLAVGASRWQLVRQLLVESLILALAGGLVGLGAAASATGLLAALLPTLPYPVAIPSGISGRVLLVTATAVGLATVLFGLVPALQASRPRLVPALRDDGGGAVGSDRGRLRKLLVIGQVALALVLLVCAGLFTRTLINAHDLDPGFGERQAVLASIDLTAAGYTRDTGAGFYASLLDRLDVTPGVRAAAVTTFMPLSIGGSSDTSPRIDGYEPAKNEDVTVYYAMVSDGYFDALRLPMVSGRAIDRSDTADAPPVVVINETMARRYWRGRNAVGGRLDYGGGWATVVGVARNGEYGSVGESPRSFMYLPIAQAYRPTPTLMVATTGAPAATLPDIRRAVSELNPNLTLFEVRTLDDQLGASVFLPRLASMLLASFGGLALLLAVIGLYGVVAYAVSSRTREIGVRMALGAEAARIRREVLRSGVSIAVVGLAAGIGLAVLVAPLLRSQLIGVRPIDPVVFVATPLLLLMIAALAAWVPAWRAARIDPVVALRDL